MWICVFFDDDPVSTVCQLTVSPSQSSKPIFAKKNPQVGPLDRNVNNPFCQENFAMIAFHPRMNEVAGGAS